MISPFSGEVPSRAKPADTHVSLVSFKQRFREMKTLGIFLIQFEI